MPRSGCFSIDDALRYFAGGVKSRSELAVIDVHLDGCSRCRVLLEDVAKGLSAGAPRMLDDYVPTFEVGTLLVERYSIDRFIAAGGMGEVYEATDRVLGERVALKTVRAGMAAQAAAVRRLGRELKLARRITHPNVCRVFDVATAELDPPVTFLTMALLDGHCLRELLRQEKTLAPARALALWRGILEGLTAAHSAGVLHRDLKPDNVMVTRPDGGSELAVITDFGLASALQAESTWHSGSGLVGTVGYIAPEQISSRNVTAAADVYSAGVVLYEMLTGRVPELGRLGERSLGPVSEVVNAEANVMPALNLASRCLELAPTRRPTIAQLLADLDALNQRDATRPPGRASTLRRKVLTIATAATIAAATAVFTRSRAATPESARPGPKLVVERTAAVEAELVQPAPGIERNVVPSPLAPPVARPARRRTPAAPRPLPTSAPNNAGAHVTNHPAQRPDEIVRAFDPADRPVRDLVDPFTND